MAAHRRTASDVKLEINQADLTEDESGNPGGATDETDDIDLIDEDEDEFLNHPLVPNDSYRGKAINCYDLDLSRWPLDTFEKPVYPLEIHITLN